MQPSSVMRMNAMHMQDEMNLQQQDNFNSTNAAGIQRVNFKFNDLAIENNFTSEEAITTTTVMAKATTLPEIKSSMEIMTVKQQAQKGLY